MIYSNISDCHNHSSNSYDGKNTVMDMCQKAIELGLIYYTITDHCECEQYIGVEKSYKPVVINSYAAMEKARKSFSGKLNLLFGIELGQPTQNSEAAQDALSGRDYDFVIGSLHSLANRADFCFWDQLNLPVYDALDKYFDELTELVLWGGFDSLAHLTYPLRYIVGENGITVDFDRYLKRVQQIYKLLIEKNIALEVNTSGLRQQIGETLPNFDLIKLYHEQGGKLITVGSDAHSVADLGKGIEKGLEQIKNAGFSHYTVFKNRKPIMIEIK